MTHRESMVRNIKKIQNKIRTLFTKTDIDFYETTMAETIELVVATLDSLIIDLDPDLTIRNLIVTEILQRIKFKF